MADQQIILEVNNAQISTFTSYNFDSNILIPASAFRFTASGVDKDVRNEMSSGDFVNLYAIDENGKKLEVAIGCIIDETDTHIVPNNLEYVISGRDIVGQLVDNSSVDDKNQIINLKEATINTIVSAIIANTKIPPRFSITKDMPTGKFLFQTNAGETKINALQRYLELANGLIWMKPDGTIAIGKPNFTQSSSGNLTMMISGDGNNLLECRVRRNINQVIKKIVTQLQGLEQVDTSIYTKLNNMNQDIGRSVYEHFSYGAAQDAANLLSGPGNQKGLDPQSIGDQLSSRAIARDNMKILDVECVIDGHIDENGNVYSVDKIYSVSIEDENVNEDMYVYAVSHEFTLDHGTITRLRLCKKGTICAYAAAIGQQT